jgi:hypothetical protein
MSKRKLSDDDEASLSSMESVEREPKVFSNKTIDPKSIPPRPQTNKVGSSRGGTTSFEFRIIFTNGQLLRKFLEPVAHSVKKMRFTLVRDKAFTGFSMEAHDSFLTLANKSKFECDVEGSLTTFCVNTSAFMQALNASSLKDTTISITKYTNTLDSVTFEAINNESDVKTVYTCSLVENSEVESLDTIKLNLGFHVNIHLSLLKDLSLNARKCGANTLAFNLWQATEGDIVHSKMTIGFSGVETSGTHEFYLSAKKIDKTLEDGSKVTVWEPQTNKVMNVPFTKKCSSEYDNNKLRLFVNHMECAWVLVHLNIENDQEALVLEFIMGGKNTKHIVIIAPKLEN